ncbi:cobalamin B12-binding domain-containing protein [Actinophytocola glycyrrhizae]|uniref:Cobalamin B12-binding domain-containing protein n=1 Tax=Actinophytocola glycyrrhizae TaxID=2044873 RepID=A0ABV9S8Z2_9PSEU
MAVGSGNGLSIVISSTASDTHTWNLVFLRMYLEELGHDVVNLGPCVAEDELVPGCLDARPDVIVLSSVNGHGFRDGLRAIARIREHPDLRGVTTVIGGKLDVAALTADQERALADAGFDAVFSDSHPGGSFVALLAGVRAELAS